MFDLSGKVAVVTGASSGLGADAALAYAEAGANVALLARRKAKLDEVVKKITATGHDAIAVECDVSKEESVKAAVEEVIKHYKKIDILLNDAGVAQGGSVETLTVEQWDKSMNINVKGDFLMCKYVIPHMKAQKYGRIVNIASVNAVLADKPESLVRHVYNASKAAVLGLTKGLAASYAQYGINVNAIGPALFSSEMTENTLFKHEAFMNMYNSLCPASRPGAKGELNGPLIFFSSDACSYVTGQFLIVDGGFSRPCQGKFAIWGHRNMNQAAFRSSV
ncbi:MAG: SDR family NAD(P)-dependent oxidoreductase [Oscillospiraceae bacterium]